MIQYRIRLERLEDDITGARQRYEVARVIAIDPHMLEGTERDRLHEILRGAFNGCLIKASEQDLYLAGPVQGRRADRIFLDEPTPGHRIQFTNPLTQLRGPRIARPAAKTSHTGW